MPKRSPPRRKRKRKKTRIKSPAHFVAEERAPRTPGRPYNPRTPVRSTGGRPKGKGRKHIVARTPGGKDYYCGDLPVMPRRRRNKSGELEPRNQFRRRRLRKLELSLRLCEKEKRLRRRRPRSDYERRSNELWNATVRALMRRYVTSLHVLGYKSDSNRLLGRLRTFFGSEVEETDVARRRRLFDLD